MIARDRIERARPFLEPALEYTQGTHTYADVVRDLDNGLLQLWDTDRAAVVTEIIRYPRYVTCHVFLAGGELSEIERMAPIIEDWAKAQGCAKMTLAGRAGWTKSFLRDRGYRTAWTVMSKEL